MIMEERKFLLRGKLTNVDAAKTINEEKGIDVHDVSILECFKDAFGVDKFGSYWQTQVTTSVISSQELQNLIGKKVKCAMGCRPFEYEKEGVKKSGIDVRIIAIQEDK